MTEFRVLPIRGGEAMLLRSPRGGYLVDGGAPGQGLAELLRGRGVHKLRAAICTAVDTDRLGGLAELLESGYPVSEYWFPAGLEALVEMARRFNGDWSGWLGSVQSPDGVLPQPEGLWSGVAEMLPLDAPRRRLEGAAVLLGLALTACLGWSPYGHLSREAYLHTDDRDALGGLSTFFGWTMELLGDRAVNRFREPGTCRLEIMRTMSRRLSIGRERRERGAANSPEADQDIGCGGRAGRAAGSK